MRYARLASRKPGCPINSALSSGKAAFAKIKKDDLYDLIKDKSQGYNILIFEKINRSPTSQKR
ncbi:hypothetical protein HNR39_003647 [Glaciimonas immobilis]|uniref:Uncharacterized protein n=1 Tax=Glaciimonas immobilis TaxID=728004 RepID=A0A840RZL4_9BURK|nr:hypothetical protein [Glaciimonas immobilis]